MLLITTAIPIIGDMNKVSNYDTELNNNTTSMDIVWSDNFDSYRLKQRLDGTPDDGGWKGWWNLAIYGANVLDDQSHSSPQSVAIRAGSDLIHEFSNIRSGSWVFTDWVYVPSDYRGGSYICLISYYDTIHEEFYSVFRIGFFYDGENGIIYDDWGDASLPLLVDQWVKIQVEFDLDADWYKFYYNDELLLEKEWTDGYYAGDFDEGFLNLAGIDLWCNYLDPAVYHDDMSLEGEATGSIPDLNCDGSITLDKVEPKSEVSGSFIVENIGEPDSRLEWRVYEYPNWSSDWNFEPRSGRLIPEDGQITVEVSFTAPNLTATEFNGTIRVIAVGDPTDYHDIPIKITTPKNRIISIPIFEKLLSRFPILKFLL